MKNPVFIVSFALTLYGVPGFAQNVSSLEEAVSAYCQGASYTLVSRAVPKGVDQNIDIQVTVLETVDLLWKTFSTIEFTYRCHFNIFIKNDNSDEGSVLVGSAQVDILLFRDRQEAQNETHTRLVPVSEIHLPNKRPLYTALRKLKML